MPMMISIGLASFHTQMSISPLSQGAICCHEGYIDPARPGSVLSVSFLEDSLQLIS